MKNGFCTLNRWLGKKNKEKNIPNGKLSKSTTNLNLSVSSTNVNETSQLEYNRITPLPVVTSNAPFEQTFRITVLLPKDQLYVARLGARVLLRKLLELVCENKQLEAQKYEFRNPVDLSQIYSCDLTIGAVGLSEVRLCHKSEAYDNFNADEVMKLHRTSVSRDSLSSSEFSSRHSKHTMKTASPYSSSNSLNSTDSTGISYSRSPAGPLSAVCSTNTPAKILAPPRKKRTAPRPPSQCAIPERSAPITANGHQEYKPEVNDDLAINAVNACEASTKQIDSSVPQQHLVSSNILMADPERNSDNSRHQNSRETNGEHPNNNAEVEQKNARNLCRTDIVHNLPLMEVTQQTFPEPTPRRRVPQNKKKTAPAPPSGSSAYLDEHASTLKMPEKPQELATPCIDQLDTQIVFSFLPDSTSNSSEISPQINSESCDTSETITHESMSITPTSYTSKYSEETSTALVTSSVPTPIPRITTTTNVSNTELVEEEIMFTNNVSKIMLNRTPTPEPRSLSTGSSLNEINPGIDEVTTRNLLNNNHSNDISNVDDDNNDDNCSKQADSGIGEPVPSPIPDSLPSDGSTMDGKTLVQQLEGNQEALVESISIFDSSQPNSFSEESVGASDYPLVTSENNSWNLQIPISPPPNFADKNKPQQLLKDASDVPLVPNISEVLHFQTYSVMEETPERASEIMDLSVNTTAEETSSIAEVEFPVLPNSLNSPMNEILDELNVILNEQRIENLIKKPKDAYEIEAAKPSLLSNFSITSIAQQAKNPTDTCNSLNGIPFSSSSSPENVSDEDKVYRKRTTITNGSAILKQRRSVTRADSCHATMQHTVNSSKQKNVDCHHKEGLNSRCVSQLSLNKFHQDTHNLQRRRSSSELSIGESPSLQSLEIIKTILNARRDNFNKSYSDGEAKSTSFSIQDISSQNDQSVEKATEHKPKNTAQPLKEVIQTEFSDSAKAAKESSKTYRYSGPPSINFSTWNERPKAQVVIKNEGDYIFGGKKAANQNNAVTSATMELSNPPPVRNYRTFVPAEDSRDFKFRTLKHSVQTKETVNHESSTSPMETLKTAVQTNPNPSTTIRMGIPEKPYRIPIIQKPIEADADHVNVELRPIVESNKKSVVANTLIEKTEKTPEVNAAIRTFSQYGNPSTLPRTVGSTRFSMPLTSTSLLRSTSITRLEKNKPNSRIPFMETQAVPFGQSTLRKTGFKEKILAQESATVNETSCQRAGRTDGTSFWSPSNVVVQNSKQNPAQVQENRIEIHTVTEKSPMKSLQCAKLKLKLKKPNDGLSAISLTDLTDVSAVTMAGSPSPLPNSNGGANKSHRPVGNSVTPTEKSRDQLLEAIRNFKREALNRP